jgi:hypothetical protein
MIALGTGRSRDEVNIGLGGLDASNLSGEQVSGCEVESEQLAMLLDLGGGKFEGSVLE